jgi:dienelactone hydrolase
MLCLSLLNFFPGVVVNEQDVNRFLLGAVWMQIATGVVRWQFYPLYLACLVVGSGGFLHPIVGIISLALLVASLILSFLIPAMHLLTSPRGEFRVGLVVDVLENGRSDKPTVCTTLYPVNPCAFSSVPWFSIRCEWAGIPRLSPPALPLRLRMVMRHTQAGCFASACIVASRVSDITEETIPIQLMLALILLVCFSILADASEARSRFSFRAPYLRGRQDSDAISACANNPSVLFSHLPNLPSPALDGSYRLEPSGMPCFPIAPSGVQGTVIFSHGLSSLVPFYYTIAAELASHGYVVCMPHYSDGSAAVMPMPDGSVIDFIHEPNENEALRTQQLADRLKTLSSVVEHLGALCSRKKIPEGKTFSALAHVGGAATVSVDKLILAGHSFGASTSLEAAARMEKGTAGVAVLDPWFLPLPEASSACYGLKAPLLMISAEHFGIRKLDLERKIVRFNSNFAEKVGGQRPLWLTCLKAKHSNFSDVPYLAPEVTSRLADVARDADPTHIWDEVADIMLYALHVWLGGCKELGLDRLGGLSRGSHQLLRMNTIEEHGLS